MKPRIDVTKYIGLGVGKAMLTLSNETAKLMDPKLFELVKIRASQLNGCAYCLDMHTKDARLAGETEQRLYTLSAWHETPFFTPRERAALEYTEAVTRVGDTHVPDDLYARVSALFDEDEMVALTFAVVVINAWNRLAISFRVPPGSYNPRRSRRFRSSAGVDSAVAGGGGERSAWSSLHSPARSAAGVSGAWLIRPSSRGVCAGHAPLPPVQALGPTRVHFLAQTGACPRSWSRVGFEGRRPTKGRRPNEPTSAATSKTSSRSGASESPTTRTRQCRRLV